MQRMPNRRLVVLSMLFITFCGASAQAVVHVVATIFPVADMVQQVGREAVEVVTLLPAGANVHTFEPTPAQIRAMVQAGMLVEIGAGLDTWAGKLKAARREPVIEVTLTAGVPLLGAVEGLGGDPHVWLDPLLVRDHLVPAIVAGLSRADPDRRQAFERAAADFQAALTRLDAEIRGALAAVRDRNYVAFHPAWRYFGARYDLREVAAIESFPGKEPSAQEIAAVIQRARAAGVRMLVVEPQLNTRVAEQIARDIGAQLAQADPLGNPDVPGRNHYLDLMRYNLHAFAEGLR